MFNLIDEVRARSGRTPDLVLAGHVHNYQRFTRTLAQDGGSWQILYIVAGCGGYWHLHTMTSDAKAATLPWALPDTTIPSLTPGSMTATATFV